MKSKSRVFHFRLTEDEAEKFEQQILESGYTASSFFREVILKNKTQVVKKEDAIKVIYHLNKMGNNLNQIAHGINKAFFESIVTEDLMEKYLRQLNTVQNQQRQFLDLLGIRNKKD
ncbi:MAG: plasmid mobilization relaxosome protein MobC [Neisseriaceae bacterium]|nr:MAG: plasmid mobilization relaxosome protein MobC [Neisseriaceae bacterium]